jgi:predicted nucleic acid-binding protein
MGRGLTLDTGALIALERGRKRMKEVLAAARVLGRPITIPTVVVAEWWRGQRGPIARLLEGVIIELPDERLARIAGVALAATRSSNAIDALVVASAAQRGDVVYTSDVGDLTRLAAHFPAVRIFRV